MKNLDRTRIPVNTVDCLIKTKSGDIKSSLWIQLSFNIYNIWFYISQEGTFFSHSFSQYCVCVRVCCRLQQLDRHCQSSAQQVCELLAKQNQLMQERNTLSEEMQSLRIEVRTHRGVCDCVWLTVLILNEFVVVSFLSGSTLRVVSLPRIKTSKKTFVPSWLMILSGSGFAEKHVVCILLWFIITGCVCARLCVCSHTLLTMCCVFVFQAAEHETLSTWVCLAGFPSSLRGSRCSVRLSTGKQTVVYLEDIYVLYSVLMWIVFM